MNDPRVCNVIDKVHLIGAENIFVMPTPKNRVVFFKKKNEYS